MSELCVYPNVTTPESLNLFVCLFVSGATAPMGQALLIHEVSRSHTTSHQSRQDSSGRVINPSQRPLPDNTQHSQKTSIHAPGGIRTHDLSMRAAADLRLRPRGHWDRQNHGVDFTKIYTVEFYCNLYSYLICVKSNKLKDFYMKTYKLFCMHVECVTRSVLSNKKCF